MAKLKTRQTLLRKRDKSVVTFKLFYLIKSILDASNANGLQSIYPAQKRPKLKGNS